MSKTTACDFEGTGPAGTTLTNANTGGVVAIGVGCTAISTSSAGGGSFAGEFAVPATNVSSRVTSAAAGGTQFALSFKFKVPTGFATTKRILIPQNSSFGTICSFNYNGTTNRLQVQNTAGAGTLTLAFTLTLDTWYRVETVVTVGTTGSIRTNIYTSEGTTPLVAAVTSAAFDMGTLGLFQIVAGINANGTTVAGTVCIDSVRFDPGRVSEIGPEALTTIDSDADARWRVRNLLSSDLSAVWRVRNALSSDADARWRVRNALSSDLDARWRVRAALVTDLDARWRVRNALSTDLDARWRVRNAVSTTLSALWRVFQPPRDVQVDATLAAQPERQQMAEQDRIVVTLGAQDG